MLWQEGMSVWGQLPGRGAPRGGGGGDRDGELGGTTPGSPHGFQAAPLPASTREPGAAPSLPCEFRTLVIIRAPSPRPHQLGAPARQLPEEAPHRLREQHHFLQESWEPCGAEMRRGPRKPAPHGQGAGWEVGSARTRSQQRPRRRCRGLCLRCPGGSATSARSPVVFLGGRRLRPVAETDVSRGVREAPGSGQAGAPRRGLLL